MTTLDAIVFVAAFAAVILVSWLRARSRRRSLPPGTRRQLRIAAGADRRAIRAGLMPQRWVPHARADFEETAL